MTILSWSRIARATRSAARLRPGMSDGSCSALSVGRRKSWQSCGSRRPRLSRIWAMSGDVRSRLASSAAAAGSACARFHCLGRYIPARCARVNPWRNVRPWRPDSREVQRPFQPGGGSATAVHKSFLPRPLPTIPLRRVLDLDLLRLNLFFLHLDRLLLARDVDAEARIEVHVRVGHEDEGE